MVEGCEDDLLVKGYTFPNRVMEKEKKKKKERKKRKEKKKNKKKR